MRKSRAVVGFWLMHCLGRRDMMDEPLADLFERTARGELVPQVGETYAMSDVRRAHEDLQGRRHERQAVARPERLRPGGSAPVGHDPHVHARQAPDQALGERFLEAAHPASLARPPHEHIGRAAFCRHSRRGLRNLVVLLHEKLCPEDGCQPAQRLQRLALLPARRRPRWSHVEEVELGGQALGRAPSPPDEALGGLAGRTSASTRSATGCGASPKSASSRVPSASTGVIRRLASTSSATWRSATSRSADRFSTRKKLLSARGHPLLADTPGPRAAAESVPRASGRPARPRRRRTAPGPGRSPHAHPGQLRHLVVQALQMLHVHGGEDVHAGVEHIDDVLPALGVLEPGAFVWASSSTRHSSGRGGRSPAGPSPRSGRPCTPPPGAGASSRSSACAAVSARPWVSRTPITTSRPAALAARPLLEHPVCLADPRGHAEEDLVAAPAIVRHAGIVASLAEAPGSAGCAPTLSLRRPGGCGRGGPPA